MYSDSYSCPVSSSLYQTCQILIASKSYDRYIPIFLPLGCFVFVITNPFLLFEEQVITPLPVNNCWDAIKI